MFSRNSTEVLQSKSPKLENLGKFLTFVTWVLSEVPTLVHPDPSAKVSLSVNASGSNIKAVLQQDVAGFWAPLAFYSKKLSSAKSRYYAFDQDAFSALRDFRFLLERKKLVWFTDHKSLSHALFRTFPPWSAMQQRHLSFLSEFNCDV